MTEPKTNQSESLLPVSPSQTIGPFFHDVMVLTGTNVVSGADVAGEAVRIEGRVLDGKGDPVNDALLEIWQVEGAVHEGTDGSVLVRSDTADEGRFSFTVMKPGASSGRSAPFVLVRLFARGLLRSLVTRIYFESAPDDPVMQSIAPRRQETLIAERDDSSDPPTYRIDIHLQGERETVFFDLQGGNR